MTYLDIYKSLCEAYVDDDTQKLNAVRARQIVLAKSMGMCDPSLLIDGDGGVLGLREMCKTTMSIVENRNWLYEVPIEQFIFKMMGKEQRLPVILPSRQVQILEKVIESNDDISSLRRALLGNARIKTTAIHFFKWDGSCRTASEIREAILTYPAQKRSMLKLIGMVIAGALAIGGALYVGSRAYRMANNGITRLSDWEDCLHSGVPIFVCQDKLMQQARHLKRHERLLLKTPQALELFILTYYDKILKSLKATENQYYRNDRDHSVLSDGYLGIGVVEYNSGPSNYSYLAWPGMTVDIVNNVSPVMLTNRLKAHFLAHVNNHFAKLKRDGGPPAGWQVSDNY